MGDQFRGPKFFRSINHAHLHSRSAPFGGRAIFLNENLYLGKYSSKAKKLESLGNQMGDQFRVPKFFRLINHAHLHSRIALSDDMARFLSESPYLDKWPYQRIFG